MGYEDVRGLQEESEIGLKGCEVSEKKGMYEPKSQRYKLRNSGGREENTANMDSLL